MLLRSCPAALSLFHVGSGGVSCGGEAAAGEAGPAGEAGEVGKVVAVTAGSDPISIEISHTVLPRGGSGGGRRRPRLVVRHWASAIGLAAGGLYESVF